MNLWRADGNGRWGLQRTGIIADGGKEAVGEEEIMKLCTRAQRRISESDETGGTRVKNGKEKKAISTCL
jgi:hypothetical protein